MVLPDSEPLMVEWFAFPDPHLISIEASLADGKQPTLAHVWAEHLMTSLRLGRAQTNFDRSKNMTALWFGTLVR
jgi:hypothetical protein